MNIEELNEYDSLTKKCLNILRDNTKSKDYQFVQINERINYIDHILQNRNRETTFTDNN